MLERDAGVHGDVGDHMGDASHIVLGASDLVYDRASLYIRHLPEKTHQDSRCARGGNERHSDGVWAHQAHSTGRLIRSADAIGAASPFGVVDAGTANAAVFERTLGADLTTGRACTSCCTIRTDCGNTRGAPSLGVHASSTVDARRTPGSALVRVSSAVDARKTASRRVCASSAFDAGCFLRRRHTGCTVRSRTARSAAATWTACAVRPWEARGAPGGSCHAAVVVHSTSVDSSHWPRPTRSIAQVKAHRRPGKHCARTAKQPARAHQHMLSAHG